MKWEYLRPAFKEALAQEQNLRVDKGRVHIRYMHWAPDEVLEKMVEPAAYDDLFGDWADERREELTEAVKVMLDETGQLPRFRKLKEAYQAERVLPFVGAGMSQPSEFPGWTAFIRDLVRETTVPADVINDMLKSGLYEEAAQCLADALGPAFNEAVENAFGSSPPLRGCVQLLPHVFDTSVITTNFDDVLKRSYGAAGVTFSEEMSGSDATELPRMLGAGRRVLLSLHGRATSAKGRILTAEEYEQHYGTGDGLQNAIGAICTSTLLFLGCSLTVDRTLLAMKKLVETRGHDNVTRHYAFLALPKSDAEKVERRDQLVASNIYPIWYHAGTHDESIESLLLALLEP